MNAILDNNAYAHRLASFLWLCYLLFLKRVKTRLSEGQDLISILKIEEIF
jgi:hypothetical protein